MQTSDTSRNHPLAENGFSVTESRNIEKLQGEASYQNPSYEQKPEKSESTKINLELIDTLMNLAGELVLCRNQLRRSLDWDIEKQKRAGHILQNFDLVTGEMQEHIMRIRLQPLSNIMNKFPRIVSELSHHVKKEIEIIIEGGDVELNKSVIEGLSDPLMHLIRNCADHGIETPAEREKHGKPRSGRICLSACHEGGQVNISITDDGRGIDVDRVAQKVVEKGLMSMDSISKMSRMEKLNLIFLPGLSTAETVSDISGRGVGMDVVKTNIERLNGQLEIESIQGAGTTIRIRLPLTLAIISSLIIGLEKYIFVIPQTNVKELICIRDKDVTRRIEHVMGAEVLRLRERLLPIARLADVLGIERTFFDPLTGEKLPDLRMRISERRKKEDVTIDNSLGCEKKTLELRGETDDRRCSGNKDLNIVVLSSGKNKYGLIFDALFNTEEIVVKPLPVHVKDCMSFAGVAIMGDGRVAMILDIAGIAKAANFRFAEVTSEETRRIEEENPKNEIKNNLSVVIFNIAPEEFFALPLCAIYRIEIISQNEISQIGEQQFIRYAGAPLPLIRIDKLLKVSPLPENLKESCVIIPKTELQPVGILVSEITDTADIPVEVRDEKHMENDLSNSVVFKDKMITFLNIEKILNRIFV
jgi:two-component system, chemotaxis family, sensor kinase CheA